MRKIYLAFSLTLVSYYGFAQGNAGGVPTYGGLQISAPDKEIASAIAVRQDNNNNYGFDFALDQALDGKGYFYAINNNHRTSLIELDRSNNSVSFPNGKIAIGTSDGKGYMFAVNGSAIATSMTVKLLGNWPDYVFADKYNLMPLAELEKYITANRHLPEMPSGKEIEANGQNLGEINAKLLKSVEELTLRLIDKDKQLQQQEKRADVQDLRIQQLEDTLKEIVKRVK